MIYHSYDFHLQLWILFSLLMIFSCSIVLFKLKPKLQHLFAGLITTQYGYVHSCCFTLLLAFYMPGLSLKTHENSFGICFILMKSSKQVILVFLVFVTVDNSSGSSTLSGSLLVVTYIEFDAASSTLGYVALYHHLRFIHIF